MIIGPDNQQYQYLWYIRPQWETLINADFVTIAMENEQHHLTPTDQHSLYACENYKNNDIPISLSYALSY